MVNPAILTADPEAPEAPHTAERATPLRRPVSMTLPPGNGLSTTAGVWLVPATITAAIGVGTLIRTIAPGYGFEFALGCLVLLAVAGVAFVLVERLGGLD